MHLKDIALHCPDSNTEEATWRTVSMRVRTSCSGGGYLTWTRFASLGKYGNPLSQGPRGSSSSQTYQHGSLSGSSCHPRWAQILLAFPCQYTSPACRQRKSLSVCWGCPQWCFAVAWASRSFLRWKGLTALQTDRSFSHGFDEDCNCLGLQYLIFDCKSRQ